MGQRERQNGSCPMEGGRFEEGGGEKWADMGDLLATWDHSDLRAQAAAKGHVWVCGPAASAVCVDVCGSCYH